MKPETVTRAFALAAAGGLGSLTLKAGDLERLVLRNGLEVILAPKGGVPLVTVEIAIRAGAFIETPDLDGLTHLHEHMFFKANRAIPDQAAYLKRIEELGMSWNGSTSHEVVRYYFTLPSELLREGLEFLRDAIQSPLFLADELEKERKVVLGEYDRAEAAPSFHLRRAVEKALFSKHYSRKNVIGDRQVIAAATREKLQFIQDEFYVPNNAALILSGDLDPKQARQAADQVFASWERRPDPFARNPVPEHPPLESDRFLIVEKEVRTATVLLSWQGPRVDRDLDDAIAADVIATALNHPGSRFQRALVDSGLATRAQLGYYTLKHVGPVTLQIEGSPEKALEALRTARRELDALAGPGYLSAEEVQRAARELVAEDAFSREKILEFANQVGFWWSVGGIEYYLEYARRVEAVRPSAAERFGRRYLPAGGARTAAGILLSPEARRALDLTPEAIGRAFVPEGAAPAGPAVASADLPNGARVLSRRLRGAQVAAFGFYFRGHAERSSAETAGLEQLLFRTLADGLERREAEELARLGARVRFEVEADHSLLGIECLRAGLERAVELLAGTLRRAEIRPEDVERHRSKMLDAYRKTMDNPDQAVGYVANRTFYPAGHPYLGYPGGTEESLKRLTLEQLTARRSLLLTGRRLLVAAAGDLGAEEAAALAARAVGDLPSGATPAVEPGPLAGPPARLTTEERAIPTSYIVGKFPAPRPGEPDQEALSLALAILHRKLFLEVRSKRALTYAVMSGMGDRARNAAYLYVSSTRPNDALRAMFATVDALIQAPIPEDEFRGSVLAYTTRHYLRQESAAEQADALAREELIAGDCQRVLDLRARLGKVVPADVQRVLKRYVCGLHFGVVGPRGQLETLDRALFTSR